MIENRSDISSASRIVLKAGTSVVSNPDGFPSLTRIANIVESASRLVHEGKQVMLVTSGAVGVGKQRLSRQGIMHRTVSDLLAKKDNETTHKTSKGLVAYNSACAAAGQLGLMSLYENLFNQFNITVSQVLVTSSDFASPERRRNIQYVLSQLLSLGIIPLLNENDAVSANQGYDTFGCTFSDNDSLASLVAVEMQAQLLVLLTDVSGVYDRPPTEPGSKIIDIFRESTGFQVGQKSLQGRGGMGAKVAAAMSAIKGGVSAVVIAAGEDSDVVGRIINGKTVGTLFLPEKSAISISIEGLNIDHSNSPLKSSLAASSGTIQGDNALPLVNTDNKLSDEAMEVVAKSIRTGSRQLQELTSYERSAILLKIAQYLEERHDMILEANAIDMQKAITNKLSTQYIKRLELTKSKIATLSEGIRSIAAQEDCIGQILSKTELAEALILEKVTCSIGVLLVIFESRPDCLPQIAALSLYSGNGLLLKGGKEAEESNICLHRIICDAIKDASNGKITNDVISLIISRGDISSLLKQDKYIDLVIPRGSNELVSYIKANTKIPVLGHADGVCHIYVAHDADPIKAERIIVDAKTDYPSACNALECLLIHEDVVHKGLIDKLLRRLRAIGVSLYGGPTAMKLGLTEQPVKDMHTEYGDLKMSIEVVSSMSEAIEHINTYGSSHTESIITESLSHAEEFIRKVDSACVFHNASTRFADGFRFGLGAEVGISTGRIHARGPVGIEGLLTSKWILRSTHSQGHIVSSFSTTTTTMEEQQHQQQQVDSNITNYKYTHKKLSLY